jgi:nucleotide-binding universal stress UspA family protein
MITIKKILVPTDLSTVSVPAIGYAGSLAKDHDAEIVLLHVISTETMKQHFAGGYADGLGFPTEVQTGIRREPNVENIYETKKQVVLGFLDQRIGSDFRKMIKVRPLVKLGKLVDEIIAAAKEEKCDLIVMTSEGAGLRRLLGGTVTERVVRHAPCPVLSMQLSAEVRTENDERLQVKLINRWAA